MAVETSGQGFLPNRRPQILFERHIFSTLTKRRFDASHPNISASTAMVGGAIAMAILDLLVRKNILTVDDVQGALTTAQSSLISSPAVHGSLDGARVIGEIKDLFARRERGQWNERRG